MDRNNKRRASIMEFLRYLVVGFTTTGINWGVTILLTELTPLGDPSLKVGATIASAIAWIISTIFFAFWAYKLFVFRSKSMVPGILWKEFIGFISARLFTLVVELGIIYIFCDLIGFDHIMDFVVFRRHEGAETGDEFIRIAIRERYIVKLFATAIVTILNYIFSKLIIFKKGQKLSREEEADRDEGEKKAD